MLQPLVYISLLFLRGQSLWLPLLIYMLEINRVTGNVFLPLDCVPILTTITFVKKEGDEELGILIGKYLIFVLFYFLRVIRPLKVLFCQDLE